jgi:hypothetical protein
MRAGSRMPGGGEVPTDSDLEPSNKLETNSDPHPLNDYGRGLFGNRLGACPRIPQDRGNRANGTGT